MSEQVDHEAAKRLAEARLLADMHPSSGDKNLSRAYLDLDAKLEAAHANADELQSRLDTVTASHCKMLRELQAERQRVDRLVDVIENANGKAFPFAEMQEAMDTIMKGRDND